MEAGRLPDTVFSLIPFLVRPVRQAAQGEDKKVEGNQVQGGQEGDEGVLEVVAQDEDKDIIDPAQGGGGGGSKRRLAEPEENGAG